MTIPGVKGRTADVLIAECGVDMGRFATAGHLASWAGICPGHDESAGRRRSGATRKGSVPLRTALTEAAQAAARSNGTYLAARYRMLVRRRGKPKAIGAIRHDILVAYWHIGLGPASATASWARTGWRPEVRPITAHDASSGNWKHFGLKVTVERAVA